MKISQQNLKANANFNTLIAPNHAPIQTVLLNVEGLLMIGLLMIRTLNDDGRTLPLMIASMV